MTSNVGALFAPRNVVIVGASDRNWSVRVHGNLERLGFAGQIYLVNPNRSELWGKPCYARLADLPEPPDHLAIFLPADETIEAIEAAGRLGARSASLFASGFGEGGDEAGKTRAARLRIALRQSSIAAVGPNCMGLSSGRARFATIPDEQLEIAARGAVALITQSGMLMQTLSRGITSGGCDIAYMISCGNQTGLTFADYFDYLADDDELRVIACYVESIIDAGAFFKAAARARQKGKSIVVTKIGGSESSRRAALAHTGALAGALQVFDALAREAGIVRVDNIEDLVDSAIVLARCPRPHGPRIGFVTNSGAMKSLATETGDALGVAYPALSDTTALALRAVLSDVEPGNPLDTKRTLTPEQYIGTIAAVHDDPSVDSVLIAEELPRAQGLDRKIRNFEALDAYIATRATKPVVCFSPVTAAQSDYARQIRSQLSHTTWLTDLNKTLRVVSGLSPRTYRASPGARQGVPDLGAQLNVIASGSTTPALNEVDSKQVLRAFGIATPRETLVSSASATRACLQTAGLRFPIVAKAVSAAVAHKSDAGLVMLDIRDEDGAEKAAATLVARCAGLGAACEGILLAEQLSGGVEVVVGMHRDPECGPIVMFGAGGILLELIRDVAFGPPGLDADRARDMISSTRVAKLLAGYRGKAAVDVESLVAVIVAVGKIALQAGDLLESVEINPLLVRADGAYALDALVVCSRTDHVSGNGV